MNTVIITYIVTVSALILSILIFVKVSREGCHGSGEPFNTYPLRSNELFPEPDRRVMKGSIDCTYSLGGGNTAYCNDWIRAYRKGELCNTDDGCHPSSSGAICCEGALKCCNQIATCGGGNDCRDSRYTPTKENNLFYDQDYVMDK